MMWAPFLNRGAVLINLGDVVKLGGDEVICYLHELDHMMTRHLKVVYYDHSLRRQGVAPYAVSSMVLKAIKDIK